MFETPAKRDIDYALSMLMHEARRQVADEKDRLTSEAIKHGAVQSNRVVVAIADAADKVHTACITQAKQILIDFVHRMERPATEITAWARPHLENLNNVVLAGIPPNGFPDDHQRIISQYQAAFQQRAEGTLREVEIGYVKGSGFSTDTAMSDNEEWVSAASAVALLGMQHFSGTRTICKRAHVGLIKARAQRFIHDERSADDVDVPVGFWWAEGEAALYQNWTTGDFDTWIDHHIHLQAFGVTFRRSDIERSKPTPVAENVPSPATTPAGIKIFIGHGRSPVWRELKDFLQDRLHLTIDEFNSVSTAGVATTNRLEEMVDVAAFAFLVMTAEDEQPDGKFNPRLNVIHEAGLFQGRLGFKKAIVLLEEGCEEFSNIHGLGQIRFPSESISAKFEEIRAVLEREKLIT